MASTPTKNMEIYKVALGGSHNSPLQLPYKHLYRDFETGFGTIYETKKEHPRIREILEMARGEQVISLLHPSSFPELSVLALVW